MDKRQKTKQLLKILIGAAWLDGILQPAEIDYLKRMAIRHNIAEEADIKFLLSGLKPIKPEECYRTLEDYLGDNHNEEDYLKLLEAISGLIYSDGEVQVQEALLLDKLQLLDPAKDTPKSVIEKLTRIIQKLYQKAIRQ